MALGVWKAYTNAAAEILTQAAIVHDRFHISQYLDEAVDKMGRQENKELLKQGDNRLVGPSSLSLSTKRGERRISRPVRRLETVCLEGLKSLGNTKSSRTYQKEREND